VWWGMHVQVCCHTAMWLGLGGCEAWGMHVLVGGWLAPHARDIQGISSQVGLHLRLSMWVHSALVGVCSHTVKCVGSGPCVAQWLGLVPGLGH
jgi:hypothetical protein